MMPSKNQKLFTLGRRCGRLANRLIIFANLIALAEEQGHRVINYTFHSYSDLFEATRENVHCAYPVPKQKGWCDRIPGVGAVIRKTRIFYHLTRYACLLNERLPIFGNAFVTLRQLPDRHTTLLDGPEVQGKIADAGIVLVYGWWLRAPNLVRKHGDKIREYFRPLDNFETASHEAVEPLRRNADVVVGVHIRHGDYRTWKDGKYFFPVERYAGWMRELAAQFPGRKVSFLVCSDERRSVDEFPGLSVGLGTKSPVSDVFALAQCDYIFGPNSTFSQWASFYGDKPLLHLLDRNDPVKLENFRVCYLDWD
jgi:Glycosyl transferase family 11